MTLPELIRAGGDPMLLRGVLDGEARDEVARLVSATFADAKRQIGETQELVAQAILGLYAHGFMVGREHAKRGLPVPGVVMAPLTEDVVVQLIATIESLPERSAE